jgi:hypothetical protein
MMARGFATKRKWLASPTPYGPKGVSTKKRRMAPGAPIYKTVPRTRGIYGAGEMKYFDTFRSGAAIQSSPNWIGAELDPVAQLCLFAPVTGATIQQRIGRKVYVHKIKVKGTIIQPPAASQANPIITPFCRLMLVMDPRS